MKILFYTTKDKYGFLSNFTRAKQIVDGVIYPTNEHYYQAQKSTVPEIKEWIRTAPNPFCAMMAGRNLRKKERDIEWDSKKEQIMFKGLVDKFTQNSDLKNQLIATGDNSIHENSPTDLVWGIKGEDLLGKLLMKVREKIKKEKAREGEGK